MSDALRTPAWQLVGLTRSLCGILAFRAGHLSFTTGEGKVFDVALSAVRKVHFPWYYFGGGIKITIAAQHYRISFVRPNDGADFDAGMDARSEWGGGAALEVVSGKSQDILRGRRAGKAWKNFFARHDLAIASTR